MDVGDFGAGLMLLRWLVSVVLIIGGIAAVAFFVDWLRIVLRRRAFDGSDGFDGRPASVSVVPDLDSDSGLSEAKVSSLDAARAGRAGDSTGARVA